MVITNKLYDTEEAQYGPPVESDVAMTVDYFFLLHPDDISIDDWKDLIDGISEIIDSL